MSEVPKQNTPKTTSTARVAAVPKYLIAAVIAILIIVIGVYAYSHKRSKPVAFGDTSQYLLKGGEAGEGISFSRPGKMSIDQSSTFLPYMAAFNFVQAGKSLGYIAAESPLGSVSNYQKFEKPSIQKSTGVLNAQSYKNFPGIAQFIKTNIPADITIDYSAPTSFKNPAITSDAWQFDLKLTNKSSSETNEGKLVFILGKNNYYIFMAVDQGDTWEADQVTWTGVLNSIRVDQ